MVLKGVCFGGLVEWRVRSDEVGLMGRRCMQVRLDLWWFDGVEILYVAVCVAEISSDIIAGSRSFSG